MKKYFKFEIIILTVVLLINFALTALPLTNVVGYELSAFNGIVLFIASGISVIYFLRKEDFITDYFYVLQAKLIFFLVLFFLPLLVSIISTLFLIGCPVINGIWYYLVIVLPAAMLGISAGLFFFWLNEKFSYLFFLLSFLLLCFIPVLEFYFYHQVYFYSPLIGFLPGTIYDTNFDITVTLLAHQVIVIMAAVIPAFVLNNFSQKEFYTKKIFALFLTAGVIVVFELLKPSLGFATDRSRIEQYLKGKSETEHFTILYPLGINEDELRIIELEHEYYFRNIEKTVGYKPSKKILSILFKDRKQKGLLFGAENADVAKTWQHTVYLQIDDFRNTLKHELAHIFSAEIGVTPFKIAAGVNFSMIEGYAMAIENEYAGYCVHDFAALANFNNFKIDPEKLFSPFNFFENNSSLSYVVAGSFIKYLIENYDIKTINKIYTDLDFEKHTGKTLKVLSKEYLDYINKYEIEVNPHISRLYFGRKPLVLQFCPRYVNSRISEAAEYFSRSNFLEAENIFMEIFRKTKNYEALQGVLNSLIGMNKLNEADSLCKLHADEYSNTSYQYSYEWKRGEILARIGQLSKADSIFQKIADEKPGRNFTNLAKIRHQLFLADSSEMQLYITGSSFDRYKILTTLNNIDLKYYSIPAMITLAEHFDENYKSFIEKFKEKFTVNSDESSFAAFELSEYALKNNYIVDAEFFAVEAMNFVERAGRLTVLQENLNKIRWIKEQLN